VHSVRLVISTLLKVEESARHNPTMPNIHRFAKKNSLADSAIILLNSLIDDPTTPEIRNYCTL